MVLEIEIEKRRASEARDRSKWLMKETPKKKTILKYLELFVKIKELGSLKSVSSACAIEIKIVLLPQMS